MKKTNVIKKLLSFLILLAILFPSSTGNNAFAASKKTLTATETSIAKAYVSSYESGDLSNIKKYTYPTKKIKVDAVPYDTTVKVFYPKYTKTYDAKSKMDCVLISCITVTSDGANIIISKGTIGINLKTLKKKTYAFSKNTTMAKLTKIQAASLTEPQLNDVKSYLLNKYGEASTLGMLFGTVTNAPSAAFDSPAALGTTYTYHRTYASNKNWDKLVGEFNITINSVTNLTDADLKAIGYKKMKFERDDAQYYAYKLAKVTWTVKDVKIAGFGPGGNTGGIYKRNIRPTFLGYNLSSDVNRFLGRYVDSGFTNSFQDNLYAMINSDEIITEDTTASFTVTGNVIFPVSIYEECYFRIENTSMIYPGEYMYFKIQ